MYGDITEISKKAKEDKLDASTKLATELGVEKKNDTDDDTVSEAAHELCIASNELAQAFELLRRIPKEDLKKDED